MDTVAVVPDVADAALPPSGHSCALVCANLGLAAGVAKNFHALFPWSLDPIRRESGGTVDLLMDGPTKGCSLSAALAMACRLLSCCLTTLSGSSYQIQ